MMNKVRVIRISKPILKKVHYNLRLLIALAVQDEIIALTHLKGGAIEDYTLNGKEDALDTFRDLKRERKELRDLLAASICVCGSCGEIRKDHVYNPVEQRWYC